MPIEILMPALSPTMEEGTLAKWNVKEGDTVNSGDVIAEIETDKATMEFETVDEGVIGKVLVAEGSTSVAVNTPIAILLEDGEEINDAPVVPSPVATVSTPTAEPVASAAPVTSGTASPTGTQDRVFASPLAKRIAMQKGLDLSSVKGSGPNGRIVKADVEQAEAAPPPSQTAKQNAPISADAETVLLAYADRPHEIVELDGMRRTIASRLQEAKQTIPHFYLRREINIDALLSFRKELNAQLEAKGVKLSVNDFIIKASALALQDVPDCNAIWAGDRIARIGPSDVAVAVAVDGGLFTPVIRDSETKTLSTLSKEMKDLASRARNKKLSPHEYQGGSFAISNLGMMGIENFDAVINPPHGSILAVGAGVRKPIVDETGAVQTATMMSVTLSVDHRVIDGALGAEFLAATVSYLENPLSMLA